LVVPLLGLFNNDNSLLELLHSTGDYTSIYFLLPMGSLSVTLQYFTSHRQRWIASIGVVGLMLVTMANFYSLPYVGHIEIFHFVHRGLYHRLVNIIGCTCLLGSNQLAHSHAHETYQLKQRQRYYNRNDNDKNNNDMSCSCILHDATKNSYRHPQTLIQRQNIMTEKERYDDQYSFKLLV
jgi:hypothetical protein